jgi:histidine ammonia-lyase
MTVVVGEPLAFEDVVAVAEGRVPVRTSADLGERMAPARRVVEDAVASGRRIYGVTTGFGGLSNVRIPHDEAERLQRDVVRSHATAVGEPLPREVVRAMLLLKARTFSFGISGVRPDLVDCLTRFLNEGIHPQVPCRGSLGASGDLALLAHLALPLMGEGAVEYDGAVMPAAEALDIAAIPRLDLSFKEGLSLVNGTEGMLAIGVLACARAETLERTAGISGAMTLEACLGTDRAFDESLIALRRHAGARIVARNLRRILDGSEIVASHRDSEHLVQDAYSLRCIPQVHGAYRDGISYVRSVLEAELESAIDNPSVIVDTGEVLSGGNFHGEALGLALDHLCLCVTGFGTIAERRIARLVDPVLSNGLPAFLTEDPGRRSGFMLAHYTAASLVAENRALCFPASSDSIPTSAGQEDHVSMGATSGRKALQALGNSQTVIAVEALAAAQGLELRAPLRPSPATSAALDHIRKLSPHLDEDRPLAMDMESVGEMVKDGSLVAAVEAAIGPLD